MTYAFSGGDLLLTSPRMKFAHRLSQDEALGLLDAHRQEYRLHREAEDMWMAREAEQFHEQLRQAIEEQKRWKRASK